VRVRAAFLTASLLFVCLSTSDLALAKRNAPTDSEIKRRMIAESIAEYPGSCPCPYNVARNGSSCGRRSAWSRPGGEAPLCFPSDISAEMVADYRAAHPES
jgi:hypothetical protein